MTASSTALARLLRNPAVGSLLALVLLGAACNGSSASSTQARVAGSPSSSPSGSGEELQGCIPACAHPEITEPGDLPRGEYQTVWFFGGEMRLMVEAGWTSREDSTSEFVVSPLSAPDNNDVLFWEDVYPVEPPDGTWNFDTVKRIKMKRIGGVPLTAGGLLDWMRSSPNLELSSPTHGAIGELPATVVDVRVADDAVNDDPNCPVRACFNFLGFPQWVGPWGIAGGPVRFYLSDVTYGGADHLFVAAIYPEDPADMQTLGRAGERLIDTVRVPAEPA
jgi:hypothetical protein